MWFKNLRIDILNWLAAGRITIEKDKKPIEYTMANTYSIGGSGLYYAGPSHQSQQQVQQMNLGKSTINFNVAKANGGWIVQVNSQQTYNTLGTTGLNGIQDTKPAELYLIGDDADFDKELGRIVTMSCLKA